MNKMLTKGHVLLKWFALVIILGTAVIYGFREPLIKSGIDALLIPALQKQLDADVTIGGISTDLYSGISVTDIAAVSKVDNGQPYFSFVLERADYHFRLNNLLHGVAFFIEQSRVVASGGETVLTLVDNEKETPFTLPEDLPVPKNLQLPEMDLLNIALRISSQGRLFSLENLTGKVRGHQENGLGYGIELQAPLFSVMENNEPLLSGPVSLDAAFNNEGVSIIALQYNKETILEQAKLGRGEDQSGLFGRGRLHLLGIETDFSTRFFNNAISLQADAKMHTSHALADLAAGWKVTPPHEFSAKVDAHLDLNQPELSRGVLIAQMEDAVINDFSINKLFIDGTMADETFRLAQLDIQSTGNQLRLRDTSVQLVPILQGRMLDALREATSNFQISLTDIAALAHLAGHHPPVDKVPTHSLHLSGHLGRGELTTEDASLQIDNNQLNISTFSLALPSTMERWQDAAFTLRADLSIPDPAILTSYLNLDESEGRIQGNINLSGTLSKPGGRFDLSGEQLIYNEITLDQLLLDGTLDKKGNIQSRLMATSPDNGLGSLSAELDFSLNEKRLICRKVEIDSPHVQSEATMDLLLTEQGMSATLHSLFLSRQGIDMQLTQPAQVFLTPDSLTLAQPLELTGDAGAIRLDGTVGRNASGLTVTGSGITSDGWIEGLITKDFSFSGVDLLARIEGTLDEPDISLAVQADNLSTIDSPLTFSAEIDADYTNSGLHINQCNIHDTDASGSIRLEGFLPLIFHKKIELLPAPISLTADIDLPDAGIVNVVFPGSLQAGGSIQGQAKLQGTWNQPDGSINLQADGLHPSSFADWLPPEPASLQCSATLSPSGVKLANLSVASSGIHLDLAGDWIFTDKLDNILPDWKSIPAGNLDIKGGMVVNDIGPLARQVAAIHSMAGRLEARLSATGTIDSPSLEADLHLNQGMLRFDTEFPVLRDINIKARLNPDSFHLIDATAELGGSPFRLNGDLYFARGEDLWLALVLDGENVLLHRDDSVRVRADSKLSLEGSLSLLTLSGKMILRDSMYTKDLSLRGFTEGGTPTPNGQAGIRLFSIMDEPLSEMKINVAIESGEPFLIRNNIARGSLRPDLRLTGTGRFPELQGIVYLDPIRVSLPAGTLTIDRGTVRFPVNNPEFPVLNINASSKMMGYDIDVHIGGRYDEPVITLSSTPPLADEELLLLLLAGVRPRSDTGSSTGVAGGNIAMYLGRGLLASWFNEDGLDSAESFLDRLDIDVGRAVTRQGDATIEARLRIAEGVIKPNDTVYLKTEKDVYDHYNTGVRVVFRFR